MGKSDIIRKGSRVRIVEPKFVQRVGYPKTVADYLDQARARFKDDLDKIYLKMAGGEGDSLSYRMGMLFNKLGHHRHKLENELAYALALNDGFGGTERSIHWLYVPECKGIETKVADISRVMTGTYYPPREVYSGYDGPDYRAGGLKDRKCHVIATLYMNYYEYRIPTYHLEKL